MSLFPSPSEWSPELKHWLHEKALEAGFDTAGVAPVAGLSLTEDTADDLTHERLDAERFAAWIDAGRAGEMDYLKRRDQHGLLLRSSIQTAMPWARSVIVCALNYNAAAPLSIDQAPENAGWIARYAWSGASAATPGTPAATPGSPAATPGTPAATDEHADTQELLPTDYHDQLLTRLQHIEAALRQRLSCETKCYVDTGPLIERSAAAQAGIGWIGKNTCVLNQQLGSWFLLGVIVTSLPVAEGLSIQAAADRCGTCTRCIDACPTDALIAPRQMDATRCIAYLTIEKKGSIPEDLRPLIGRQVFGCDICQDVCPWNRRAPIAVNHDMQPRPELVNPTLSWLAEMDASAFRRWFRGSPLERTRKKRLHRNVAIAMGNTGNRQFLPQLEAWTASEDEVLADTAKWAATRIRTEKT